MDNHSDIEEAREALEALKELLSGNADNIRVMPVLAGPDAPDLEEVIAGLEAIGNTPEDPVSLGDLKYPKIGDRVYFIVPTSDRIKFLFTDKIPAHHIPGIVLGVGQKATPKPKPHLEYTYTIIDAAASERSNVSREEFTPTAAFDAEYLMQGTNIEMDERAKADLRHDLALLEKLRKEILKAVANGNPGL